MDGDGRQAWQRDTWENGVHFKNGRREQDEQAEGKLNRWTCKEQDMRRDDSDAVKLPELWQWLSVETSSKSITSQSTSRESLPTGLPEQCRWTSIMTCKELLLSSPSKALPVRSFVSSGNKTLQYRDPTTAMMQHARPASDVPLPTTSHRQSLSA